jgi:hypothetical protein
VISLGVSSAQSIALQAIAPQVPWSTQRIGPDLVRMTTTWAHWRSVLGVINSLAGCVAEAINVEARAA